MTAPAHPPTCVCYDCLPGGPKEHRVRPWPATVGECAHPDESSGHPHEPPVTRARSRLRIPLLNGTTLIQCRLCGRVLEIEKPETQQL